MSKFEHITLAESTGKNITVFFVIVGAVCCLTMLKNLADWIHIRKRGSDMQLREFFKLRWQGVKPSRIAAAQWMAAQVEGSAEIPRSVWVSFYKLHVDVIKLAAAYVAASQAEMTTSVGVLGAAALSGQDPLELVQKAHKEDIKIIDTKYVEAECLKNH